MASYFHGGPEIHPDGLQTLYLMNPSFAGGYSDSPTAAAANHTNMIFFNSPLNSIPQQPQPHFVGIPLQPTQASPRPPHADLQVHRGLQYNNLWTPTPANPQEFQPQLTPKHLSLSLSPQQAPFMASSDEAKLVGLQSVLMGSKYLKAAQQLLDEVASVGRDEMKPSEQKPEKSMAKEPEGGGGEGSGGGGKRSAADLSTAERQELQMKKAKLVNMLDEVEQRYRQYHHQMQVVVSSFEAVAGFGSARAYTALALRTISRQFRCLRDAITGQIRAAGRSLGEEEEGGEGGKSVGSRLRFVDHQLRQQRALQQLGMIQHNAWRPQRGLPERAVSVLRAWLFEHFLHPYPKDSDKHMLAKQTGLTRSQVSNWFINARVRLWKPMVEEMYLEETKEQEQNDIKTSKSEASEQSASQQPNTPSRTEHNNGLNPMLNNINNNNNNYNNLNDQNHSPIAVQSSAFESMMQHSLKKARTDESIHQQSSVTNLMSMDMKPDELSNRELLMKFMDQGGGFGGGYPMGEVTRFDHGQFAPRFGAPNGVSLTLGLPHCETLSLSGSQQTPYISNESMPMGRTLDLDEGTYFSLNNNTPSASRAPNGYESISIQSRKRFAAQLLPDYVA